MRGGDYSATNGMSSVKSYGRDGFRDNQATNMTLFIGLDLICLCFDVCCAYGILIQTPQGQWTLIPIGLFCHCNDVIRLFVSKASANALLMLSNLFVGFVQLNMGKLINFI